MSYNAFARIAKLVALLGLLLPWVVVSCSNTVIASATGVQLMTGDLQPAGPLAGQSMDHKPEPDMVVIAMVAVIVLGLAIAVFARGKMASGILLASSLVAVGLCFYSIENLRAGMNKQAHSHRYEQAVGSEDVGQSIANMVQIETREGFWVTVGALGLAAMLALGGFAQIRVSMGALSEPKRDPAEPPH